MARLNTATQSLRQLRRFCHLINVDKVFGTHSYITATLGYDFRKGQHAIVAIPILAGLHHQCPDMIFGKDNHIGVVGGRTLLDLECQSSLIASKRYVRSGRIV
jgi:hypothetical protein